MASSIWIDTSRLVLRTVTTDDVEDVARSWRLDGELVPREEAERLVAWMLENHRGVAARKLTHLCLAIVDKGSQEFIGWCGLDHREKTKPHPVLFYLLKERYWGKGLATEAAQALIDYAFRELCLSRIDAEAAYENIASKRVMEKIGMRYLGLGGDGGYSFTITRGEYMEAPK